MNSGIFEVTVKVGEKIVITTFVSCPEYRLLAFIIPVFFKCVDLWLPAEHQILRDCIILYEKHLIPHTNRTLHSVLIV